MKPFEYKICTFAIVFITAFGMFAEAKAESVYIQNTVSSYSNSGGIVKNGADGKDGEDGKDGQPGQNGQSVISGNGSASVHIKTVVNGETKVDIKKSQSASGTVSIEETTDYSNGTSTKEMVQDKNIIFKLLEQIRLILIAYVPKLD